MGQLHRRQPDDDGPAVRTGWFPPAPRRGLGGRLAVIVAGAAGAQLLALGSHVSSLIGPDALARSIVSTRVVAWLAIMARGFFGFWKANAAPYANENQFAPNRTNLKR